jgi:CRP-like cAMP-binding protein
MPDRDTTSQQRAAFVMYALCLRALANMPGLTTSQVAQMIGITYDGARRLMNKLEAGHRVPISNVDGR